MALYIYITLISLIIHFVLIVPFINILYKRKLQRADQKTLDAFDNPTPIFDKYHRHKSGTPVGGGILVIGVTSILTLFFVISFNIFEIYTHTNYPSIIFELILILFTFISYGFLGIYDDLNKIFFWDKKNFFGLRMRVKLILEIFLAVIISCGLYFGLDIHFINIPFLGVYDISFFYIIFSTFVIVAFANAVNITDGLDGLASGVLMIALMSFWAVARSIIDVPLSIFIGVWIGGLIAFLYFNTYPARIFLGDTGALSFGAAFAVIGLLLGKVFALPIIGGVFVIEILTSFLQLISKKYRGKKIMDVAPLHLLLQHRGWEEPKIVMRFWIVAIVFALIGLMIAFLK
ncbi:phospho-N-acetylmuramoyl-pentapeptide-transferase [Candidatus Roizmanbacteria bacterium CG_4_10_14_0_2_um_filter_36_9]|uniref:Phospho-N-acetylmuramoyl-pentapeptide-transferase n=3 Tax=Candidatus Roizmaniibacteriota TaxID=1752723 RepID=A0A2M7U5R4_9BACT|nr:MAG: phospho-N-acetylmuramoyl-pentapeptide-transferase [Candidatus Roizmanbacteria bacterium CG_4_10_14_0_2_um_filter_36_9]